MPCRPLFGRERCRRYPSKTSAEPAFSSTGTASSSRYRNPYALRVQSKPGDYPEAAVLGGRIVERDPDRRERSIAGWDVGLVLVPGLAGLALRLDEEHGLHHLHVRSDHVVQGPDGRGEPREIPRERRDLVGEVDAQVPAQHALIVIELGCGDDPVDGSEVAAADRDGLGPCRGQQGGIEEARKGQVAVAVELAGRLVPAEPDGAWSGGFEILHLSSRFARSAHVLRAGLAMECSEGL